MKPIILLLVLCNTLAQAQTLTGRVVNEKGEPLSLTNIVVIGSSYGTLTSEDGNFRVSLSDRSDSIRISNISYNTKTVAISDVQHRSTIVLEDRYAVLPQVVIKDFSRFTKTTEIGYHSSKKNGGFRFGPGMQLAVYIPNTFGKEVWVRGIYFNIKKPGDCNAGFRIRLYEGKDADRSPGDDLLRSNVIVAKQQLKKNNFVDLDSLKLVLPLTGIFAGIEWLNNGACPIDAAPMIEGNLTVTSNISWLNYMGNKWSRANPETLIRSGGKIITPNIGLKIRY